MGISGKKFEVDSDVLLDLIESGNTLENIGKELNCSQPTLRKKIAKLQEESPVLLQYRTLQTLELTKLQHQVLNAITPERINTAPLRDLVLAYKILKEKEFMVEGKPTEVKGLVHYLMEIERMELAEKQSSQVKNNSGSGNGNENAIDAEFTDGGKELNAEGLDRTEAVIIAGIRVEDFPL